MSNSALVGTVTFKQSGTTRLTTTKSYDQLNRLASITNAPGSSLPAPGYSYTYNAANQRTRATREDNTYWAYGYDALGQVTSGEKHLADTTPVNGLDYAWTFDDIGNRATATVNGQSATYTANSLNQYTERTVPGVIDVLGSAHTDATVTVTFPASGGTIYATTRQDELYYKQLSVTNSSAAQYPSLKVTAVLNDAGPNGEDVIAEDTRQAFVAQTPEGFVHDADGNLTADARWTYTWDGENRLVAMETAAAAVTAGVAKQKLEYGYDGQSRRVAKKVFSWSGSAWVLDAHTLYLYDGWNMIAELDGLASKAATRTYVWGSDLSGSQQGAGGVGGLLLTNSLTPSAETHAVCYDGNGNVIALVDMATGDQSGTYDYNAFGETVAIDGDAAEANPFRFSSKYNDGESGLLYYGFRYYQPATGRWPSRDPIGEKGGICIYAFLHNNTNRYYDYMGLAFSLYRLDVFSLKLTPATYSDDGTLGLHTPKIDRVISGPDREGNLTFTGELEIILTHREKESDGSLIDPAVRTGADLLTINEHERKHARLTKDVWNKMVLEANKYEGRYCSLRCGRIARRIVEAMLSKAASEIELVSFRFDDEQYGLGRNPKINNGIKGAGGAFDRNIAVLEVALQEFESEECSLP